MEEARHFIAGEWVAPANGETIAVIDPSDGAPFARLARGSAADIDAAVRAARGAFEGAWGATSATERGRLLFRLSQRVAEQQEALAQLECRDTGKPLKQARADAAALARYFEFYAGAADKLHGETLPYQNGYTVLTIREAHGVTGHIVPWNYPMQIFGRSVGAALATGNACVVKPAEDACLSLLLVARLAAEAGLPGGALNIVTGYGHEAGAALSAHPGIDHISFTGSPDTGRLVAQAAAERHVPVTLELGGKSPQIVFADADLDTALPVLVSAIVQNGGQTCSAGSRVLIEHGVYEPLLDRLATAFNALRVGPGLADLDCGPLINAIATKTKRWRSPTAPPTAWWPASGPATARARCGSRGACAPARCSSTTTARAAASSCPSAAAGARATGARRVSRRSTASPCSRPSR